MSQHTHDTLRLKTTSELERLLGELGAIVAEAIWEHQCSGCCWADMTAANAELAAKRVEEVLAERR